MKNVFLFLFFISALGHAEEITGKVIRVIDGDTIDVLENTMPVRIRLQDIDAPEKKQPFGSWSADQMKKLVAGQSVTISYTARDRYGRIIGRVSLHGTDASTYMVNAGAAWVYDRYNTNYHLPDIQRQAQAAKRGLWAGSNPVPPWVWRRQNH